MQVQRSQAQTAAAAASAVARLGDLTLGDHPCMLQPWALPVYKQVLQLVMHTPSCLFGGRQLSPSAGSPTQLQPVRSRSCRPKKTHLATVIQHKHLSMLEG
jgi:hypothetical protein